jgi:2-C-methyl-D-erythritol 4-phosphate cytidylyltransferase
VTPDGVCGIVVAAGRGERLGGAQPKAFQQLAGRAMYLHAVDALVQAGVDEVVVVVPPERLSEAIGQAVPGGATRAESVRAGLATCRGARVAVHDAARPLATADLVRRTIAALEEPWAAVAPGLPVADTLKLVDGEAVSRTVPRAGLWAVQTPQVFWREALVTAHGDGETDATDDLELVERTGRPVRLIRGERRNFKVTFPEDLELAEHLLERR